MTEGVQGRAAQGGCVRDGHRQQSLLAGALWLTWLLADQVKPAPGLASPV